MTLPAWLEVGQDAAEYPLPLCAIGGARKLHIWKPGGYGFKPICGAANFSDVDAVCIPPLSRRPICRACRKIAEGGQP